MKSSKEKAKEFFNLSVDLATRTKVQFRSAPLEDLQNALGGYLNLVQQPIPEVKEGDDPATVEVSCEILHQLCLLASAPLAKIISEKYRVKHG